jgi:DNA-directed RNA polymerase subunit RPC12/RpoP
MAYYVCPRCHLTIRSGEEHAGRANVMCPRCLGRLHINVEMFRSPLTHVELAGTARHRKRER